MSVHTLVESNPGSRHLSVPTRGSGVFAVRLRLGTDFAAWYIFSSTSHKIFIALNDKPGPTFTISPFWCPSPRSSSNARFLRSASPGLMSQGTSTNSSSPHGSFLEITAHTPPRLMVYGLVKSFQSRVATRFGRDTRPEENAESKSK